MKVRRQVLGAIVLLVAASATGCGGQTGGDAASCANPPSKVLKERPVEVAYRGPVAESSTLAADPAPRLIVQVTNSEPSVERVRLVFDDAEALDVDLPPDSDCDPGPAVFSVAYDRPSGPIEVQLDVQGSTSTSTIDVPESGTAWAVVNVQSERAWGDINVYDERPFYG
jgi:hypothetical protein